VTLRWLRLLAALAGCVSVLLCSAPTRAHRVDAAFLSLVEVAPGRFHVKWQAGSSTLERLTEPAIFPAPCRLAGTFLECGSAGLTGTIEFPWLAGSLTHLVVDIEWQDRSHLLRNVTADVPRLSVYSSRGGLRARLAVAGDYIALGVEHIATGFDHLLFVVALTLLVTGRRRLLLTVTAFTIAHSLSLAATVLGLISLPSPPVEACIALSIVLLCVEGVRPADSLTARAPWAVALVFGLLHGLGFASALLEIGLPRAHLPLALACFNVGVELGQLLIVAVVLTLAMVASRLGWQRGWQRSSLYYAMGSIAAAWSLERVTALLGH
jgi:hydrogenase/urease accessory protein HupE